MLCRATYRRVCESLNKRRSRRVGLIACLLHEESAAVHKINDYIHKDTEYKCFGR